MVEIDINNIADVEANGNTIPEILDIYSSIWNTFLDSGIRFGYYFNPLTGSASINTVSLQLDYKSDMKNITHLVDTVMCYGIAKITLNGYNGKNVMVNTI